MSKHIPQKVLIVGGGTAGWMTANLMLAAWADQGVQVSLVESPDVGIIGVGEGSTPVLKRFFTMAGIPEREWMPACNATYKAGIRFIGWSSRPGYESYFHPFFSTFDEHPIRTFLSDADRHRCNQASGVHPDPYFLTSQLANDKLSPRPGLGQLKDQIDYGYHFDSGLLGEFLRKQAVKKGLRYIRDHVEVVERGRDGAISQITTRASGALSADLYVDCTGFSGLLIKEALGERLISFKNNLFNDSAMAVQTPMDTNAPIAPETRSEALSAGWVWNIPLFNRYGNGYVYSSDFISRDAAETEFRAHLGLLEADVAVRHLSMPVGRIENHWKHNCVAIGLSQGFIEPLEATALMTVQLSIENIISFLSRAPDINQSLRETYNANVNNVIEGIRDYIVAHFMMNSRSDTDYWRSCRNDSQPSEALDSLLRAWHSSDDFQAELVRQGARQSYTPASWYCLLAGYGRLPGGPSDAVASSAASGTLGFQVLKQQHGDSLVDHRAQLKALHSLPS
ncbi:tryptophan halogenase family protein [Marinimicrobium agarilyticum]|uniref:tryptophan halogenase family protein n=1 Tax=Marinimicrobium agarilyticum TaxID=306546 RepID=UPI0006879918|nr:tryptophan halogenase family protein [Marinimicrobium agarilyticum]